MGRDETLADISETVIEIGEVKGNFNPGGRALNPPSNGLESAAWEQL